MFKRSLIFMMACCLSAPLLTSCGDDSSGSKDNGGDKVCPDSCDTGFHCDESTGYVCVADAAPGPENQCPAEGCGEGKHCDEATKTCVADNTPEKQCPADCGEGKHCDEATKECVADSTPDKTCPDSCDEGFHCDESTGFECVADGENKCPESCDEGYHCDESTGFECVADGAEKKCPEEGCGDGKRCDEEKQECVVIPEFSCPASCDEGYHCSEDTDNACVADDDPEKAGCPACAEGFKCFVDTFDEDGELDKPGTGGKCVQVDEEGNIVTDEDGNETQGCPVCPADSHCDENFKCANDGYVVPDPNACSADEKRCDGDVLMVCGEEGVFVEGETCGSEENPNQKCFKNEEGIWGCFESECTPGESRCDGTVIKTCNDAHKLVAGDDCASMEDTPICEQGDGHAECIASCSEGEAKCLDNKIMKCGTDGQFTVESECDKTTSACVVNDNGAPECKDFDCTGDTKKCDASKLLKCENGWWTELSDCGAYGNVCKTVSESDAVCEVKNCDEGQKKCSNDYLMECSGGDFNKVVESCANTNKKCVEEGGKSFCKEIKVAQQGTDTDGDTIIDALECHPEDTELGFTEPNEPCVDSDGDTIPDYKDTDSDNDTIPDSIEANNGSGAYEPDDADYDGLPNYLDTDSDDNGIPDSVECGGTKENGLFKNCKDTDGDTVPDYLDYDNDGDGFSDVDEIKGLVTKTEHEKAGTFSGACPNSKTNPKNKLGTASAPVDCDGDGTPDYMDTDSDNDGLTDIQEGMLRLKTGYLARYNGDTDGDGIADKTECAFANNVCRDSDNDGIPDMLEVDSDGDGLSDNFETKCCNGGCNWCSDPTKADSDGDGVSDLIEYGAGTNPKDKNDNPQSKGNFVFVVPYKKKAEPKTQSLSFETAVQTIDIYFAVDSSGSMRGEINTLKTKLPSMLETMKCKDLGKACQENNDCSGLNNGNAICSEYKRCIVNPKVGSDGKGCFANMWTGFGVWGDVNSFKNKASISENTKNTTDALAAVKINADGTSENLIQVPACVADGTSYCTNTSTINCYSGNGRVGCVGYRPDAIKILIQAGDEANYETGNYKFANSKTYADRLKAKKIRYIGLWGSTSTLDKGMKQMACDAGSCDSGVCTTQSSCQKITNAERDKLYMAQIADSTIENQTIELVRKLAGSMQLTVTSTAEDVDKDAVKLVEALNVKVAGGGVVQGRNCAKITNQIVTGKYQGIKSLNPGTVVCYDVVAVDNQSIFPAKDDPQVLKARIKVLGDGSVLNSGIAYFLVPPLIKDETGESGD
ncbi:MAG: hypothetical protein IJM59_06655 [Proteobacteria bacterium]|nr:hypothetical protein [Pseudomonadota bacterium]